MNHYGLPETRWLYHLICPRTGAVRYVGIAMWPTARDWSHRGGGSGGSLLSLWIRGLAPGRPIFRVVRKYANSILAGRAERREIAKQIRLGTILMNDLKRPDRPPIWRTHEHEKYGCLKCHRAMLDIVERAG